MKPEEVQRWMRRNDYNEHDLAEKTCLEIRTVKSFLSGKPARRSVKKLIELTIQSDTKSKTG